MPTWPGWLAANEAALAGGATAGQLRSGLAHSAEAARNIDVFYQETLGRGADAAGLAANEDALARGLSAGEVRNALARSQESTNQVQAIYAKALGRAASPDELAGYEGAKGMALPPGTTFTVYAPGGATLASSVDAPTLATNLPGYVAASGGLTPTLATNNGQTVVFKDGKQLAAFAFAQAVASGQDSPATRQAVQGAVSWLDQTGQAFAQAAANLRDRAKEDMDVGDAQQAAIDNAGADLAQQMQATPSSQRHALSKRVLLPDQFAADVSVSGDVEGDANGLAGFDAKLVDLDPERPGLVQDALAQASAANHDAGSPILAALDQVQERLDLARLRLPADARHDKMLDVARQFVEHARGAAASGNWNLVQTFETAADVSLQEAAQPAGARQALTERFMHDDVKHDITVDPNSADPFATFKDHSKGHDDIGAIVEAVAGAALNVAAVFQPYLWPAAAAWDTAQAGQDFADNNVLGGVLSLASAVGVGLNGLGNGYSVFGVTAGDLGLSAGAAKAIGAGVLAATALAGGTNAVVGAAQRSDGLGIAAGLLQVAAAVADGTIAVQGGGSADLKLSAIGLSVVAGATRLADGAQTGDLATALGDVGALAAAVASAVQQVNNDPQLQARVDQLVAAVVASPPAVPVGGGVQVAQTAMTPGVMTDISGGLLDPAAFEDVLRLAAAKGVELLGDGLVRIGGSAVVRGALVAAPELGGFAVLVGGAVYLAANGGVSAVPVSGYDGAARGVAPVSAEVNGRAGTVLLYRGGTTDAPDLANQHTVTLSVDADGSLSDRQGRVLGRLDSGWVVANPGVSIPGLFGDAGVATPPTRLQPIGGGFIPSPAFPTIYETAGVRPPNLSPEGATGLFNAVRQRAL